MKAGLIGRSCSIGIFADRSFEILHVIKFFVALDSRIRILKGVALVLRSYDSKMLVPRA